MKRREFITLLCAAAAWPLAARAQQRTGTIPRVGFLLNVQSELVVALFDGLRDAGYIDHQTMFVETRFAGEMLDRIGEMANELVALNCDVIFAAGPYAIQALVRATSTIPIVGIDLESDPIESGWARSIGRPGGNLTGRRNHRQANRRTCQGRRAQSRSLVSRRNREVTRAFVRGLTGE